MDEEKKQILVIDDEADLVEMLKFQLESKGYYVVTASDGQQGLEKLKDIKPDLIILDINMPKMGGLEFYNKISTSHGRAKYPVLVLTARANLAKMFKDIQVDGFMPKPFEINDLIDEVERIILKSSGQLIYLVDFIDNPHVKSITDKFRQERYSVVNVENFQTLKNRVRMEDPDFIIMEYMQKETSGKEFIKNIRNEPLLKNIPVIVYSYSGFEEYRKKSLEAGADMYLGKPKNYDTFISAVKELSLKRNKDK